MRTSKMLATGVFTASALLVVTLAGCSNDSKSTESSKSTSSSNSSSSASAKPTDYSGLLIKATDLNAPETFTASTPIQNPEGHAGIATAFSNADGTHVVGDTILIVADPAAAVGALNAAKGALGSSVAGGTPEPINIGDGGVSVSGNSPDNSKSVTVVLFTEGKAFVTLEFDGPVDQAVPTDFVTDVGQKQAAAIKTGLAG